MRLTERELDMMRSYLIRRRMYAPAPTTVQLWHPWMDEFLQKIEDELTATHE